MEHSSKQLNTHPFRLKRMKYLLAVAGVISSVFGIFSLLPFLIKENYGLASFSAFLVILGIVLIALAFGYDDGYFS